MGFRFVGFYVVLLAANYGLTAEIDGMMGRISFAITSQCSDAIDFITNKFYPVYQELGTEMDIEFIPWGKSTRDNGTVVCQFGEVDCSANRFQSCALFFLGIDQERMAEYINCEYSTQSSMELDFTCVRQVGLTEDWIQECYDSRLGDGLQDRAEQWTTNIIGTVDFVPTITYNYIYNDTIQDTAYSDFRGFVCGLLEELNSTACAQ